MFSQISRFKGLVGGYPPPPVWSNTKLFPVFFFEGFPKLDNAPHMVPSADGYDTMFAPTVKQMGQESKPTEPYQTFQQSPPLIMRGNF